MKAITKLFFVSCLFLNLFFIGSAFSEDFSADIVKITSAGTLSGKIFGVKDKMRLETQESILIARLDKGIMFMIIPKQKMYMEAPLDTSHFLSSAGILSNEVERTLVASETVSGKMTDKYQVGFEMLGQKVGVFQWVDKLTMNPIKTQAADGSWTIEYSNFVKGAQPDSLFEVPAGYQKLAAPELPTSLSY